MSTAFDLSMSPLWAIRPEALQTILQKISGCEHLPGGRNEWAVAAPSVLDKGPTKVAVIPIRGILTKDASPYYGTSYNTITKAVTDAGSDPDVKQIVLAVDSPGGEVVGLPETAAMLARVAKEKTVSAIVEGQAASAAFWLASQAGEIALTPSGQVGSVGVRMMHADVSKMVADAGIKVTEISSGNFKTEWSPFQPLSEAAKADMQQHLDEIHRDFIAAVASGRAGRASLEVRKDRFGEGRMFSSSEALNHGLVDRVQSPHDFYKSIMRPAGTFSKVRHMRAALDLERQRF